MIIRPQAERQLWLKKLSEFLVDAETLYKWLDDRSESAVRAVRAGKFNPQHDGEISLESFYGLRRPTTPVSLKVKELGAYFRRFSDWTKAVTSFLHTTSITMEQRANEPNLNQVRGKIEKDAAGLWRKQKLLIAEFNTMCGIERKECNHNGQDSQFRGRNLTKVYGSSRMESVS